MLRSFGLTQKRSKKVKAVVKIAGSLVLSLEIHKLSRQVGIKQCRFLNRFSTIDLYRILTKAVC